MTARTAIITGGNSGLGYEAAKAVAAASPDWHVLIASRDLTRSTQAAGELAAASGNEHVQAVALDLGSLASVRGFAAEFAGRQGPPLRALVCNAGLQIVTGMTHTVDGFETTFAVNHLGHFLLANLLLEHMVAPARIVFTSSDTHDPARRTGMPLPAGATRTCWPGRSWTLSRTPTAPARPGGAATRPPSCATCCAPTSWPAASRPAASARSRSTPSTPASWAARA
jgi:NAD(P)-dependent dehydrogenase (short-subunit alcohol dehydrogenase family)